MENKNTQPLLPGTLPKRKVSVPKYNKKEQRISKLSPKGLLRVTPIVQKQPQVDTNSSLYNIQNSPSKSLQSLTSLPSSEELCIKEYCSECNRQKERRADWVASRSILVAQNKPNKLSTIPSKLETQPKTYTPLLTTKPKPESKSKPKPKSKSRSKSKSEPTLNTANILNTPYIALQGQPTPDTTTMDSIKSIPTGYRLAISFFLAEFIGTFILVVIGDGSVASYVLTKQKVDTFVACFGFGVGAMIATFASGKISGAHINPAATVAFALKGDLKWKYVPVYLVAQYLGGFVAALMLLVNYSEAINYIDSGQRIASGSSNATGYIFATYPGPYVTVWGALIDQIIGTGVLLFGISAVIDKNNLNLEARHQPLIVSLVIGMTCVAFSPNCGAIFNPARDLAPRLMTYFFGWGSSVFAPINSTYWFLAGVLGPHIGAILGVYTYRFFIGNTLDRRDEYEPGQEQQISDLNNNKDQTEDVKYGSTLRSL